jgi:hypothetical protein
MRGVTTIIAALAPDWHADAREQQPLRHDGADSVSTGRGGRRRATAKEGG